jgi:NAD(P)-dependent dehydrogenase (short-subunit alcohol dehydrogenase family)
MGAASWNFAGKSVLVTGAAGGIGSVIVRKFAASGASVTFSDLNEASGRAIEQSIRDQGGTVRFIVSDAIDEDQVQALVAAAASPTGRLDFAVNNVGGMGAGDDISLRVHDTGLSAWRATVDFSLTSCFLGMKHQIQAMTASGGAIVNLTSLAGMRWTEGSSPAYSAAKAAVIQLTRYAAVAYAGAGIRVNVVGPGLTATPIVLQVFPDEAQRTALAQQYQPMGRLMDPAEIADGCLFLCSDAASGITGTTLPVDGGWAAK